LNFLFIAETSLNQFKEKLNENINFLVSLAGFLTGPHIIGKIIENQENYIGFKDIGMKFILYGSRLKTKFRPPLERESKLIKGVEVSTISISFSNEGDHYFDEESGLISTTQAF